MRRFKPYLNFLHKWLGLGLCAYAIVVALSGMVLVFYPEIDRQLNDTLRVSYEKGPTVSAQTLLNQLAQAYPSLHDGWRLEFPLKPGYPFFARYLATGNEGFKPLVVALDPLSGKVLSARLWGDYFVTFVYDLHYQWLLGKAGRTVVVVMALLLLCNMLVGLLLWWPVKRTQLAAALHWKVGAHPFRRNYDWHKLTGIYAGLLIVVLIVTGSLLGKPEWFTPGAHQQLSVPAHVTDAVTQSHPVIDGDRVLASAMQRFPHAEVRWLYTPTPQKPFFEIRLYQPGEPGRRFPKTVLAVSSAGEVLWQQDALHMRPYQTMLAWLHPLHSGEFGGVACRLLAVAVGAALAWLAWTGLRRFMHKSSAKRS